MDLHTTIIGIGLIALCAIPLAWAYYKKRQKQEQLLNELKAYAKSNSCTISNYDQWHNTVIGLDENANCLFFLRKTKEGEMLRQAHLAGISGAYTNGTEQPSEAQSLELVLVRNSANEPQTVLEFFNRSSLMQLHNELELVKKWHRLVSERIAS